MSIKWFEGVLAFAALAAALPAAEPVWQTELVDLAGGGKFPSLRIDSHGNAHVSHYDEVDNRLKYSFWDQHVKKWFTTAIDATRGFCSLALDAQERPHISYLAYGGDAQLKHAAWDGAAWKTEFIHIRARDISFYTSLTFDEKWNPSISYYEYWGTTEDYTLHLRNVMWTGEYWAVRTVDTTPGSGKFNAIARDSAGHPHIAYINVKYENSSARYARWNGQGWDISVLEGRDGPLSGGSAAIVLDKNDTPHLTYSDLAHGIVKYAVRRNGKWDLQVVDRLAAAGYPDRNGIALDDQGRVYISYYDAGRGVLKLAHKQGEKWVSEEVDGNFAGFTNSLQIAGGTIWIVYSDETGRRLKCARRPVDAAPAAGTTSLVR
jgi:hypothetical protein